LHQSKLAPAYYYYQKEINKKMPQQKRGTAGAIVSIVFMLMSLSLLAYTASRTLHFIEMTLPAGSQIFGYFALAAFDGGLLVWTGLHMFHAREDAQRAISMIMIVVSIMGVVAAFIADTLLVTGTTGLTQKIDAANVYVIVVAMALIITGNICAGVAYHLLDPRQKEKVADEELNAAIWTEARRQVREQTPEIASQLAPRLAANKLNQLSLKLMNDLGHHPSLPTGANRPAPATKRLAPPPSARRTTSASAKPQVLTSGIRIMPPSRREREQPAQAQQAQAQEASLPTAEEVVERYAPPARSYEALRAEEKAEYGEEVDQDFLSPNDNQNQPPPPSFPIYKNGQQVG
jgi:hypothetical protein